MKRPPKSFVVEHKRRSRNGSGEVASIWSDNAGRKLRSLLRTSAEEIVQARTHKAEIFASPKDNEKAPPVSTGRILEAKSPVVLAPEPAAHDAMSTPRRRGRPRKAPAAAKALDEFGADEPTVAGDPPVTSVILTDTGASSEYSRTPRPSYLERRAAARKALPIGERWKWDLRF
jgi:hypothetical protein